jgi:galactokinase
MTTPGLAALEESVAGDFVRRFGRPPRWIVAAPGRVNLIGDHVDYHGGFVLPMAIDRYLAIAAAPGGGPEARVHESRVYSADVGETAAVRVRGEIAPGVVGWSAYVQGVVAGFVERGVTPEPFDATIRSDVPMGAGLASSSALEVAAATLLETMTGHALDPLDKALLCQRAEHRFAGMPCGVMDQVSSAACEAGALMLLDCRSLAIEQLPLSDPELTVLIADGGVRHAHAGGAYAERRRQSTAAAAALGVEQLRDATLAELEAARGRLEDVLWRRARHVIGEIRRTLDAAAAVRAGEWAAVGELMVASHASLRDDYEVSCPELDVLVEIAAELGGEHGVLGSRMTGGGFGGSTVSLVRTGDVDFIVGRLHHRYAEATGRRPAVFASPPVRGAMVLRSD